MLLSSSTIEDCTFIYLDQYSDHRGHLIAVEGESDLPFSIKRIFYQYGVPDTAVRGGHAHWKCHQLLIALSGSLEVILDDGQRKRMVLLSQPQTALHIVPGIWASQFNFAPGTVCLVLASHEYDSNDYIRIYERFVHYKGPLSTLVQA